MNKTTVIDQIKVALAKAEEIVANYGGTPDIPEDNFKVLKTYLGKSVYNCLKKAGHDIETPNISKDIYYPSLMAEEFFGIPMIVWFRIMKAVMSKYNIDNGLSINSARSYVSSPWRYLPDADDLKVFPHGEFSRKDLKVWEEATAEVLKDY